MARLHFLIDPIHPNIGKLWPSEQAKVEKLCTDFEIHIIRGRLHAEALTRKILSQSDSELIVCVGGDRMVNEVVNSLATKEESKRPKLHLYPHLHREDLIRNIRSRKQFIDFLEDFLQGKFQEDRLDLIEARYTGEFGQELRRLFFGYASFGYATQVLSRLKEAKGSRFQLFRKIFRGLAFYKAPQLHITVDGEKIESETILTGFVHNLPHVQGGWRLSPRSDPRDGRMEVSFIRRANYLRYLQMLIRFYNTGIMSTPQSIVGQAKDSIRIESMSKSSQIRIEIDQELRGNLPLQLRVLKGAMCLYH